MDGVEVGYHVLRRAGRAGSAGWSLAAGVSPWSRRELPVPGVSAVGVSISEESLEGGGGSLKEGCTSAESLARAVFSAFGTAFRPRRWSSNPCWRLIRSAARSLLCKRKPHPRSSLVKSSQVQSALLTSLWTDLRL